jgi:hypothetical protein
MHARILCHQPGPTLNSSRSASVKVNVLIEGWPVEPRWAVWREGVTGPLVTARWT